MSKKKAAKSKRKFVPPEDRKPALIKRTEQGESRIMPRTEVDKFLEEMENLEARRQDAIKSLLEERDAAMSDFDEKLRRLGYKPDVVGTRKAAATGIKREKKDEPCKICGFKTEPLHDSRAHRQQNPKAPFSHDELVKRGLKKV